MRRIRILSLGLSAAIILSAVSVSQGKVIADVFQDSDVTINEANFPDSTFRSYVSSEFDTNTDGVLSNEEIQAATSIDFGYNACSCHDLTGVEYFTQLVNLRCNGAGEPFIIDVSQNLCLESLICNGHVLSSLDVRNNVNLRYLSCYNDQLTSLDVTNNPNLEFLDCALNGIKTLDVGRCISLKTLYCHLNPLAVVDVSSCTSLKNLACYGTPLATIYILGCTNLISAYVDGTKREETYMYYYKYDHYFYPEVGYLDVDSDDVIITDSVPIPSSDVINMYRLYNPNSGEHFYTADAGERSFLISIGWNDEGIGWYAPASSSTPVYRLYNQNGGEHHYTTNLAERNNLISLGWSDEGIGWYSDDNRTVPLYRQYNPNAFANNHNYTTSLGENDWLVSIGWQAEGIGWYGIG